MRINYTEMMNLTMNVEPSYVLLDSTIQQAVSNMHVNYQLSLFLSLSVRVTLNL